MAQRGVQVIGLTRWSYPFASGGFRRKAGSLAALRERLYAPARLDYRVFLLEHLFLPALRAQTDPNFIHLFLVGDQLPRPWRTRVLNLLATVPQIIPVVHPEGQKHNDLCRELISAQIDPACDATAQYRLDDDDAVGLAFVAQIRARFQDLTAIFDTDGKLALDCSRGFIMQFSDQQIEARPVSIRFWAPGMAVFQRPDSGRSVVDFHHLKIWHHMPTLTWKQDPLFIRGAHHDNDSDTTHLGRRARGFPFNPKNPERYFKNKFGFDLPTMQTIWSAQKAHFLAQ